MLLSIIIPVYNAGSKIRECIDSIRKLEEVDLEIIVINDGSTDDTEEYLKEYAGEDKRFRFYKKENSGVSDTRNYGLSLCQGKYVTFIDADDVITGEYNRIIDIIKKTDFDLYTYNFILSVKEKQTLVEKAYLKDGVNNKNLLMKEFFAGRSNSVWNNIYRTDIIKKQNIAFNKSVKMGEDLLFNAKYVQVVDEVYFTGIAPYVYKADNMGSAMHNKKLSYLDDYMLIYDELVDIRNKYPGNIIDKGNYLLQVYEVLKYHGRKMSVEQEKKLRKSKLFKAIMSKTFSGDWKLTVKQLLLRFYVYRIWIP